MASSMIRNIYDRLHRPKRLNCSRSLWRSLIRELHERGQERRESGAFLLGTIRDGQRHITGFIPYDVVDPNALQGMIVFDASRMDAVWEHCEATGVSVVADVHTHPGHYAQSRTDQAHPMIPQRGHFALIIPDFARRPVTPGDFGIYEFLGRDGWRDHSDAGAEVMRLGWLS